MKEIVIKIPEKDYDIIQNTSFVADTELTLRATRKDLQQLNAVFGLINAMRNGKVLPKGHGELKDTNEILAKTHAMQKDLESNNDRIWAINKPKYKALAYANRFIIDAPTLVEADKGEEE